MKKKNKLLRNQKGSISMFVIVAVLFLTFVLIGIYASYANKLKVQEEQLGIIQGNYGEHTSEDGMDDLYNKLILEELPTGEGTTPWLPTGFSQVAETSLETGLIIANTDNGTEGTQNYVWIEVPNDEKQTITVDSTKKEISLVEATTDEEIYSILKAYTADYTKGASYQTDNSWKEEWYDGSGNTSTTSTNLLDTAGCGMTYAQYQTEYSNMLNSIKKYGGFWIAQYEAGIEYSQANRTSHSEISIEKANYAKDQYPYNWVTCSEAQQIASEDSVSGKYTSSLPFGIQWDLVCKFLEEKGVKTYAEIATNCAWGNYDDILWTSSGNSRYSSDGQSFTAKSYTKTETENILLTTGAIEKSKISTDGQEYITNPMKIYDLAGNVSEWTLEYSTAQAQPSVRRGGNFYNAYKAYQCAHRLNKETTDNEVYTGFRSTLYTVEN